MSKYLSVAELAERWKYSDAAIRMKIYRKQIPVVKLGNQRKSKVLIPYDWVMTYENEHMKSYENT